MKYSLFSDTHAGLSAISLIVKIQIFEFSNIVEILLPGLLLKLASLVY
jgi:hypothetical protein